MKKVIAIFAIAALTACGGKGTSEGTSDSTSVSLDSTAVTATDSTTAQIPVDTTATK
jgi:hypothetical protein